MLAIMKFSLWGTKFTNAHRPWGSNRWSFCMIGSVLWKTIDTTLASWEGFVLWTHLLKYLLAQKGWKCVSCKRSTFDLVFVHLIEDLPSLGCNVKAVYIVGAKFQPRMRYCLMGHGGVWRMDEVWGAREVKGKGESRRRELVESTNIVNYNNWAETHLGMGAWKTLECLHIYLTNMLQM